MERHSISLPDAVATRRIDPSTHDNFSELVRRLNHHSQKGTTTPEGERTFQIYETMLRLMQGEHPFEIAPLSPDHDQEMDATHGAFVIDPTSGERRLVLRFGEPIARSFVGHVFPLEDHSGFNSLAENRPIAFHPLLPSPQES